MRFKLSEIGKRNSASDQRMLQAMHDNAVTLGASCAAQESIIVPDPTFHFAEADMSYGDITDLIRAALRLQYSGAGIWVYPRDVYPDSVVYSVSNNDDSISKLYQRSYTLTNATVTFTSDPVEVQAVTNYLPVSEAERGDLAEAVELTGELVPLTEAKAINKDGLARVKVISPGAGSSGYYPAKTLEAAAAKFANAQCFWDHPGATDEANRPERSLRDLAGKIVGTPTWEAQGSTGPGIYADVQVFKPYQDAVQELAPHIGMSIRALGKAGTAEVDGKKVRSIESIDDVRSVDFVTVPGRGGEILQLFEAARHQPADGMPPIEGADDVSQQEIDDLKKALKESQDRETARDGEIAKLREANVLREAHAFVVEQLAATSLPKLTRERLAASLTANATVKEGALDTAALTAAIEAAVTAATAELAEVAGGNPVRGMGATTSSTTEVPKLEESQKRIDAAIAAL